MTIIPTGVSMRTVELRERLERHAAYFRTGRLMDHAQVPVVIGDVIEAAALIERYQYLIRQYVDPFDVSPADHALVLAIGTDDEAGIDAALAKAHHPEGDARNADYDAQS